MNATPPIRNGNLAHPDAMRFVDGERLIAHLVRLASFGGGEALNDGVRRETLTPQELAAKQWLCSLFDAPGYRWLQDAAANLILRREGREPGLPPVLVGSHIDTQPVGGWLDGAYGVMAGYEVCRALDDAGIHTRRAIEVVAWTNEEGSRFAPGAMGSSAFVQPALLDSHRQRRDAQGVPFGDALAQALHGLPDLPRAALGRPVHAYLEAHIEQGPVMEADGRVLGVVEGIQGVRWFEVTVRGRSAHAGTTPESARQDALLAAAQLIADLHESVLALGDDTLRWTVGKLEVAPGSVNTIADRVVFSIDLRHPRRERLDQIETLLAERAARLWSGCPVGVKRVMDKAPTVFHPMAVAAVQAAVEATGEPACRITSGAFHDAMYLASVAPAAMLFVPSIGGISHHPDENTAHEHLIAGARALTAAVLKLAD